MNSTDVFIEVLDGSLRLAHAGKAASIALERLPDGRLTPASRENVQTQLALWFTPGMFGGRRAAVCALPARGAIVRRLTVPVASRQDLERVLALQIENELPLSPAELAWGYRVVGNGAPGGTQEVLLAAVKKESAEQYRDIFAACGLEPVFTLGVLAREALVPVNAEPHAILSVGTTQSELVIFDQADAISARVISWGLEDVKGSLQAKLGLGGEAVDNLLNDLRSGAGPSSVSLTSVRDALATSAKKLIERLPAGGAWRKLYFTGEVTRLELWRSEFASALGGAAICQALPVGEVANTSAGIAGLRKLAEGAATAPLLPLRLPGQKVATKRAGVATQWPAIAALLAVALLALRYLEPLVQEKRITTRLTEIRAYKEKLPKVGREVSFLQFLKTNQAPYLDTVAVLAKSAPQGLRVESFNMSRRGDISVRAAMRDGQQLTDFRTKLIDSGYFATVVVDEQNPSPDGQRLTARLTAQLKTLAELKSLPVDPPPTPPAAKVTAPVDKKPVPAVEKGTNATASAPKPN